MTVFLTIFSGVSIFVIGQIIVKLIIDPVHELRKTIGKISHTLIELANVIQNPGVPPEEEIRTASRELRKLSSELQSHLYLVPQYERIATLFKLLFVLPDRNKIMRASSNLIGLSNGLFRSGAGIYEANAKRVEAICDSLGIYLSESERWPEESSLPESETRT